MNETKVIASSFNRWFRLVGTSLFGLLLYLIIYYVDPRSLQQGSYAGPDAWQAFCLDFLTTLAGAFMLSETSIWVTHWLNGLLPWEHRPLLRFVTQLMTLTIASVATIWLLIQLLTLLEEPTYQPTEIDRLSIRQTIVFGSLVALFINAVHTGEYFFSRWRTTLLEAETLKRESVEARYEALKSQLDPHFLFNNLNTLTAIVEENPRQAVDFIENLSLVYRYILQKRDQTLVTLADELDLARSYLYLLEKRFGDSLQTTIDVPAKYDSWQIPPMTLQLLLENAVKHNVVSRAHPLHIQLTVSDMGDLTVTNTVQKRLVGSVAVPVINGLSGGTAINQVVPLPTLPSGVGLRNIQNRYRLLGQHPPVVTETDREFSVRVPLITA